MRITPRVIAAVLCSLALGTINLPAQVNVVTQHNDIGRTGQNINETILTPANVSSGNFGKLYSVALDGQVYAQPLYVSGLLIPSLGTHNVVFIATMHDSIYALDADSGSTLWKITLLDSAHGAASGATTDPVTDTGCTEMSGTEIGITSTPVIDPVAGIIYVVGKTFEGTYPVQRLHALSITTGAEMPNSPVVLSATVPGTGVGSSGGVLSFDPLWENQRAGLLLLNGIVYVSFAGYCDNGPWHGWILAYNVSTMQQTSVFTPTPNAQGAGIWMSGAGLAADLPAGTPFGRMFVPTGNGFYDATTPYGTNTMDYGVDVLRLDLTNGVMNVTDAFTPFDQAYSNANDLDLASGGLMILPDQTLAGHTHQLLAAGKTGNMYLVDRDSLGGYSTSTNNIIEYVSPNQIGGEFSAPAYWNGSVYYWGDEDTLKQFEITNGLMNFWHSANSSESMHYPGSTPSISSNGTTNGIVWDVDGSAYVNAAYPVGPAILYAHAASNVGTTLYSSAANPTRDSAGQAVKMVTPTVANGKVYVPTYGELDVYGLLTADFSLSELQSSLQLSQAGTATDQLTVTPLSGFSGSVSFSASGLPTGMSVNFTSGTTAGTTNATFAATTATPLATYPIVITATSGSLVHSVTANITVVGAVPFFTLSAGPSSLSVTQGQTVSTNITVVPGNGFTGAVTFSTSTPPSGISFALGTPINGVEAMNVTASASAPNQQFNLTVTGTSGTLTASTVIPVTVGTQPIFSLTGPASVSVMPGQSASSNLSVVAANGFNSSVSFSASGLPSGVSATFNPTSSTTGTAVTFTTTSGVSINTYPVVITGTSGSLSASETVNLVVGTPTFSLSPDITTLALQQGTSVSDTIVVLPTNGFSGSPNFSVSGLPTGVTAVFSPTSSSTQSSLTLTASTSAWVGTFTITVTATSGSVTQSSSLTLSVTHGLSLNGVQLVNKSTAVCVDVNSLSKAAGANIGQAVCWGGPNQLWNLSSVSTGVYQFTSLNSGLALDITSSSTAPGALAEQNTIGSQASQQWLPKVTSDGYFIFVNSNSGLCLDGLESAYTSGIEIQQQACNSSASQEWSLIPLSSTTSVNMSSAYNVNAIAANGTETFNGGIDTGDDAFSSATLGTSYNWYGYNFVFGPPNVPDAVTSATVPLPAGQYNGLYFLATATNGSQPNQTFTVNYSDGTSTSVQQGVTDWYDPPSIYAGEQIALTVPYRLTWNGTEDARPFNIYGFSMTLDSSRTAVSVTLPANSHITVLAMTLGK